MSEINMSGHPRTRGARSLFLQEPNLGGGHALSFGTVTSYDGTPIFYCSEGEGPPLVFCYGIACSSLHWTYQIDYFRKNYRCIWFDYRGHQHTALPTNLDSMTVESSVKDLKAVLDFLEIDQAVLLGHSMGVNVALEFEHQFPERVKGLVLAHGTQKNPLDTLLGGSFLNAPFALLSKYEKEKPSLVQTIWGLQKKVGLVSDALGMLGFNIHLAEPEDIKTYARQIAELHPAVLTRMMDDYRNFDATPWLHTITQPTLILSGDQDRVTPPETQDLMHQLMPNSELVRIHHGSHCATLDLPELVNLVIEKFLVSTVRY